MKPENPMCPKCGAAPMVVNDIHGQPMPWPAWVCGSSDHHGDFYQSPRCSIRTLGAENQRLRAERDEVRDESEAWRAKCERLLKDRGPTIADLANRHHIDITKIQSHDPIEGLMGGVTWET